MSSGDVHGVVQHVVGRGWPAAKTNCGGSHVQRRLAHARHQSAQQEARAGDPQRMGRRAPVGVRPPVRPVVLSRGATPYNRTHDVRLGVPLLHFLRWIHGTDICNMYSALWRVGYQFGLVVLLSIAFLVRTTIF